MPSCFCQYFICFFIANYCLSAETSAVFCQFFTQNLKNLFLKALCFALKPLNVLHSINVLPSLL